MCSSVSVERECFSSPPPALENPCPQSEKEHTTSSSAVSQQNLSGQSKFSRVSNNVKQSRKTSKSKIHPSWLRHSSLVARTRQRRMMAYGQLGLVLCWLAVRPSALGMSLSRGKLYLPEWLSESEREKAGGWGEKKATYKDDPLLADPQSKSVQFGSVSTYVLCMACVCEKWRNETS